MRLCRLPLRSAECMTEEQMLSIISSVLSAAQTRNGSVQLPANIIRLFFIVYTLPYVRSDSKTSYISVVCEVCEDGLWSVKFTGSTLCGDVCVKHGNDSLKQQSTNNICLPC